MNQTPNSLQLTSAQRRQLEAWSKRFHERLGEMLEAFTAEDMKLSRESFGDSFTEKKAASDLVTFGIFASLSAGATVAEITRLAEYIAEQRAKHPNGSLIDEIETEEGRA